MREKLIELIGIILRLLRHRNEIYLTEKSRKILPATENIDSCTDTEREGEQDEVNINHMV